MSEILLGIGLAFPYGILYWIYGRYCEGRNTKKIRGIVLLCLFALACLASQLSHLALAALIGSGMLAGCVLGLHFKGRKREIQ